MAEKFTASQVDFYIFTGETSGDDRGFEVLQQIKQRQPLARIHGVPGPKLRTLGVDHTIRMESFQVMGFIDVIKSLPKLYSLFHRVKKEILNLNPKAVLFVDYPGFNIRMAKALRKEGYTGKLIQYVCPTVWAWKKGRIPIMEENLDMLLTLLPFEPELFNTKKLEAYYVGHPLVENERSEETEWCPPHKTPFLSIFPGSREVEIMRNLPLQFAVAQETRLPIVVSCSHEKFLSLIKQITREEVPIIPPEDTDNLLRRSTFAIATSGTICLQLALHNVPTVCNYAIRPLDQFIATKVFNINLPYYCIVNILAGKEIFPEFYGSNLTFQSLLAGVNKIIDGSHACDTRQLKDILGSKKASEEATQHILSCVHS